MQAGEHAANPNVVRNPFQQVTATPTEKPDEEDARISRPRGAHVKIEGIGNMKMNFYNENRFEIVDR